MARKCSHCGRIGHNSRTCNIYINKFGAATAAAVVSRTTTSSSTSYHHHHQTNSINNNNSTSNSITPSTAVAPAGGLKLFGIQLTNNNNNNLNPPSCSSSAFSSNNFSSNTSVNMNAMMMRKSFSLDSFQPAAASCCAANSSSSPPSSSKSLSPSSSSFSSTSRIHVDEVLDYRSSSSAAAAIGYLSDGLIARPQERKKGVPWTEEEHRTFLIGLDKLGKGDWRGISKKFVPTRTPTQVASHAQKYFLRQATLNKKRRSSLFDDTIGNARIGVTTTSYSNEITTIFPNMHIRAPNTPPHSFQGPLNCNTTTTTTLRRRHDPDDELIHVHQPRYDTNWQVTDQQQQLLCLSSSSSSPTRPQTASSSIPPRPIRSSSPMVLHHDHDHDLQLTLRVPGLLPPTRMESSSSKQQQHTVLVGTF